jgi:hypothetical protein
MEIGFMGVFIRHPRFTVRKHTQRAFAHNYVPRELNLKYSQCRGEDWAALRVPIACYLISKMCRGSASGDLSEVGR